MTVVIFLNDGVTPSQLDEEVYDLVSNIYEILKCYYNFVG